MKRKNTKHFFDYFWIGAINTMSSCWKKVANNMASVDSMPHFLACIYSIIESKNT